MLMILEGSMVIYEFLWRKLAPVKGSREIIIENGNLTCAAPDEEAEYA
jgi:hypothetical protein